MSEWKMTVILRKQLFAIEEIFIVSMKGLLYYSVKAYVCFVQGFCLLMTWTLNITLRLYEMVFLSI